MDAKIAPQGVTIASEFAICFRFSEIAIVGYSFGASGFMDKTVAEWCKARHLSRSTYHKLKNLGRGPKELEIPGTRIKRITPEADAEWEARMAELAKSETARLEAER